MIRQRLEQIVRSRRTTLLGVGPMSRNCVDVAVDIANEHDVPLMLIASRRQIDSEEFGGGYVNGWTTDEFSRYVIDRDKKGKILLARDHGGPWQNDLEKTSGYGLRRAMESAKKSYRSDIDAGFDILHIDPSVDPYSQPHVDEVLDRIFELYEYCHSYAARSGREVNFEIGTEEQSGSTNSPEELEYTLAKVQEFCAKNKLPNPIFVVVQTGTRVMEMRNVGSFDSPIRVADELAAEIQVPMMIDICQRFGLMMKEHNTDYLSSEALKWHPRLGIHAANVAPEFGVAETRAFLEILTRAHGADMIEDFTEIALASRKWEKWMLPGSQASDLERAQISGHYVFSSEPFIALKERAAAYVKQRLSVDLNEYLKQAVRASIMRYVSNFRLLN